MYGSAEFRWMDAPSQPAVFCFSSALPCPPSLFQCISVCVGGGVRSLAIKASVTSVLPCRRAQVSILGGDKKEKEDCVCFPLAVSNTFCFHMS